MQGSYPSQHRSLFGSDISGLTIFLGAVLDRRWLIKYHPLYSQAMRRLNLLPPVIGSAMLSSDTLEIERHGVRAEAYVQMPYPRDEAVRYTTIMSDVKKLMPFAVHSSNLYKRMRLLLAQLYNTRYGSASTEVASNEGAFGEVLPPESTRKRTRVSNEDVANRSRLVKKNIIG